LKKSDLICSSSLIQSLSISVITNANTILADLLSRYKWSFGISREYISNNNALNIAYIIGYDMDSDKEFGNEKIIEVCSNCFSPRITPYMGYETGKRVICQDCKNISVVTIEFPGMEALVSFLKDKRENDNSN